MEQTGEVSNAILFAGYQYDKETGLYYLNARMYDPVTARFLQEDSFAGQREDPLSLNLYTYCHNSPLMYVDPTGHAAETVKNENEESFPSKLFGMLVKLYREILGEDTVATDLKKFTERSEPRAPRTRNTTQITNDSTTTYVQSSKMIVNNAGEAQYVNYLNAKRANEKDKLNTVVNIAKTNPDLELQITQLLDSSYRNSDDIYWIYDQVMEWQEPYERPKETYNYVTKKSKEQEKVNSKNELKADPVKGDPVPQNDNNVQLLLDVIEATPYMTAELQAFYQELPNWFGAYYTPTGQSPDACDCSGMAIGIFDALNISVTHNGSAGTQKYKGKPGRRANSIFTDKGTGVIVQECPVKGLSGQKLRDGTNSEMDYSKIRPGDLLFYDWSSTVMMKM